MSKSVIINFENGDSFSVPIEVIAVHRTTYYKSKHEPDFDEEKEFQHSCIPDVASDWICNDMDWYDVKNYATKLKNPLVKTYSEMWPDAEIEIIDNEEL